ncbi:hypothetical protein GCM10011344_42860 [Dokdonia pacifica]|nr:hypothetical protein GCM10011344_42860 [Dokdonia pacifica]
MNDVFFTSDDEWDKIKSSGKFDYIVIGTGFCGLAFIERVFQNDKNAKILVLERGSFFLPEHFQNLPESFKRTLGGLSETFPWTISKKTTEGEYIKWQAGSVPFFGGRSSVWSGWCPRPTKDEMINWPKELIENANKYYSSAEKLLNVIDADQIKSTNKNKPIYGTLQDEIQSRLKNEIDKVKGLTRIIPAPLAVKEPEIGDIDFSKFSTQSKFLEIISDYKDKISVVVNCVVQKIDEKNGLPITIQTSKGNVSVNKAKIVLAMGALPPTTLIRNSFPALNNIGERFTSHFISSIYARIPRKDFHFSSNLSNLEIGAFYIAGVDENRGQEGQFHIQMTALADRNPQKNSKTALMNMPDVVATASLEQLETSKDYIVFVCASLGEIDFKNSNNWFRKNQDSDLTLNSTLQVVTNENDEKVWDSMDIATFNCIEKILSPNGKMNVEYWHNNQGWQNKRPEKKDYRAPLVVHDASTLCITNDDQSVVSLKYELSGVKNIYVTGASLWPTGASWNPTLTMVALSQHLADILTNQKLEKMKTLQNLYVNITSQEILKVAQSLTTQSISGAPSNMIEFEEKIEEYFGVKKAVTVCSGTVSIYCALLALGIGEGDEVILNPASVIMSGLPIAQIGAKAVFVDTPQKSSFGFDLDHLKKVVTNKTKAVIAVPMWGYPIDIESIVNFCQKRNISVIEDVSQSHGTKWNHKLLGTYGEIGCLSTQQRKLISTGEGGLVITSNIALANKIKTIKWYGLEPDGSAIGNHKGLNFKINSTSVALGVTQLAKLEDKINLRREVAEEIRSGLTKLTWFKEIEYPKHSRQNYYSLVFRIVDSDYDADKFGKYLSDKGIISDPYRYNYTPLYNYPIFSNSNKDCPNAEKMMKELFTLPCHEGMDSDDIKRVILAVKEFKK